MDDDTTNDEAEPDEDETVDDREPDDEAEPSDTDEPEADLDDEPEENGDQDADDADGTVAGDTDLDDRGIMPPADQPSPDDDAVTPATDRGDTARARIVLAVAAALVLGALAWFFFGRPAEVVAPPSSTTTTTTTTEPEATGWPAQTAKLATARPDLSAVAVLSSPPPGWESSRPVALWEAPTLPDSQVDLPPRSALPRPDYPVEGRYTTEAGWSFNNPTSFENPLTFLVTETRGDWAKVLIPVRPNHTEGYIPLSDVAMSEHEYRMELRLSEHRLTAYRGTELIADTPVVTGKDATRTPTGRFYLTDKVEQDNPNGFFGPYILALNAYSEQLDIFDAGVPVIAIHGTSRPELLGTSASNGCVRIPNEVITQLNAELPLGTPVEIYA